MGASLLAVMLVDCDLPRALDVLEWCVVEVVEEEIVEQNLYSQMCSMLCCKVHRQRWWRVKPQQRTLDPALSASGNHAANIHSTRHSSNAASADAYATLTTFAPTASTCC